MKFQRHQRSQNNLFLKQKNEVEDAHDLIFAFYNYSNKDSLLLDLNGPLLDLNDIRKETKTGQAVDITYSTNIWQSSYPQT